MNIFSGVTDKLCFVFALVYSHYPHFIFFVANNLVHELTLSSSVIRKALECAPSVLTGRKTKQSKGR